LTIWFLSERENCNRILAKGCEGRIRGRIRRIRRESKLKLGKRASEGLKDLSAFLWHDLRDQSWKPRQRRSTKGLKRRKFQAFFVKTGKSGTAQRVKS
jgi:hypothetical protein